MTKQNPINVDNMQRYNFRIEQGNCLRQSIANEEARVLIKGKNVFNSNGLKLARPKPISMLSLSETAVCGK